MSLERVFAGARALLLDVDDTIVDTRGAMVAAGARAAAALWPDRPGEHHAMAQRYYDDPQRWFPRYASGEVPFERMRAGRLEEVATAFGLGLPAEGHVAFEEAYAPACRSCCPRQRGRSSPSACSPTPRTRRPWSSSRRSVSSTASTSS
ncbi:hypothetical protein [Terrabacter lapilli]|uniref:hypothetical protein n=1 Tax=Terrabacter lapilli TaxID=436231 RepID=UPI0031DCE223